MPITNYTSSDGKITPIVEMNNFHLVNALIKTGKSIQLHEMNGDDEGANEAAAINEGLRLEVLRRLMPPMV